MKANNKELIDVLADQMNEFINGLQPYKFNDLLAKYRANEKSTVWALFGLIYDTNPEVWKTEIKGMNGNDVEILIKKAIDKTIIPNK